MIFLCMCACYAVRAALLLVTLWCHLRNDCPLQFNAPGSSVAPNITSSRNSSDFTHLLFYFKHSERYLCIDQSGHVYSRKHASVSEYVVVICFNSFGIKQSNSADVHAAVCRGVYSADSKLGLTVSVLQSALKPPDAPKSFSRYVTTSCDFAPLNF